ncbi:MAG: hypothetical protein Q8P67_05930, partial [archaeon]|nr:hypothetical protein [archaeon]
MNKSSSDVLPLNNKDAPRGFRSLPSIVASCWSYAEILRISQVGRPDALRGILPPFPLALDPSTRRFSRINVQTGPDSGVFEFFHRYLLEEKSALLWSLNPAICERLLSFFKEEQAPRLNGPVASSSSSSAASPPPDPDPAAAEPTSSIPSSGSIRSSCHSNLTVGEIILGPSQTDFSSSSSIHTYPINPSGPPLESATIADSYLIVSSGENDLLWSIADGIGHGVKPRHAAMAALAAFWLHVEAHIPEALAAAAVVAGGSSSSVSSLSGKDPHCFPLYRVCEVLIQSISKAHELVCSIGTDHTTLLGGVILRTVKSPTNPWPYLFLGTGIGDCKCYRWSKATGLCEEITQDPPAKHMRDPGGFLGMESPVNTVFAYLCPLEEGDLIISMTDGVHDNLDPATLKISPRFFGFTLDDWQDLEDEEPAQTK